LKNNALKICSTFIALLQIDLFAKMTDFYVNQVGFRQIESAIKIMVILKKR